MVVKLTLFSLLRLHSWAHGALSALSDRIKITNSSKDEINLSIQYVLNCGTHIAGRYDIYSLYDAFTANTAVHEN